jgi:integrase
MNMPSRPGGDAGYIAAWRPVLVGAEAAAFARQVVTACGPHDRDRAKKLLWAAGKLAGYGIAADLDAAPEVLLHPSVIERFTAHSPGLSGPGRRTLRTNPRFLARAVVPQLVPAGAPLPRERAKAPYTAAEIAGLLALADAQPTAARRARACGLICLGAGAGLIRADLRSVRGTDIAGRSGDVIVQVRGSRPRVVPVLARYHDALLASAAFAGAGLLTGGISPSRRAGAQLVQNLHPHDRGPRGTHQGAIIANGNTFRPATPRPLLELGPLPPSAPAKDVAAHDQQTAELTRYKLGRHTADDIDAAETDYHKRAQTNLRPLSCA